MSLDSIAKTNQDEGKQAEIALERFKRMVDEKRKREALEYYWELKEQERDYIKRHPEGNMYLREAILYGI